ncbi:hypothetical protein GCM10007989_12100 [Devosia pacifica]|uniref:Cation efflux protein transmembrane domain-containing protein n=1 Tax=Devosia pacifica TaxID=1335967 RepID=A0A918S298_9HYPH|nr:cation diffusion facilitator family transporter [Devosia pacifica]GHA18387.1 hypothetical protein GCM10007989_12100 [Devosia pacifica]
MNEIPEDIRPLLKKAVRLEWWTLAWQSSIVAVMAAVLGSSAAMKSAWIEDILGLVPAAVFLLSLHFEGKRPTSRFPFGFNRVNSLAFLVSATALVGMGGYLIFDSAIKLLAMEHPTIGPTQLFGFDVWMGWLMVAALVYSVIPPVILGRLKQPVARALQDKVLHTDALMQKADWMTGVAGVFGVIGVGFGLWWADALAALIIALDITHDGYRALRIATAELLDGTPRALDSNDIAQDAKELHAHLERLYPSAVIRMRESGRYINVVLRLRRRPTADNNSESFWPPHVKRPWRLAEVTFEEAAP